MSPPILFDMDGVILEGPGTDPQVYADAADRALDELGAEPTPAQRDDLRRHDLENIADHCAALEIDAAAFWKLKDEYASETSHDLIRSGERGLYDDIDAIADLADRTTVGLVTNNRHATAEFVASYVPIEFDVVRGRRPTFEDFRRKKPEPDFIDDALSELDADNGFYVGDSHKDVTAGRAAGLEPIYLRRTHNRDVDRPADAVAVVDSLAALPSVVGTI
ncbi:HAD family hydrolase [Natronorubrum texcoconense]|uniref:Haloacid dehalogenase superfamily, subfamily IA, variant 1 with third motif having Dx(3-4)D or Dx(3-4)E n=1 Tax=Natronorubrum texcoconense TaxID=1095776 RepID=A0A1G8Y3D3_9EURY|nr:HAD-IA family hydrolase [Natronorubrum texcoconense]SDJ97316.1 haloacid dehalogenase superfamily, subfamily IA, variant 1 with third motif having Dx(3-4)D or Dx(3-4)E [Natronorubrum texcoconense]